MVAVQTLKNLEGIGFSLMGYDVGLAAALIAAMTILLVALFAFQFGVRAASLNRTLKHATRVLESPDFPGSATLDGIFFRSAPLARCWAEYHSAFGRERKPAGSVFSREVVIDDHLRVELFRHFPAILVGVAIVGLGLGVFFQLPLSDVVAAGSLRSANAGSFATTIGASLAGIVLAIAVAAVQHVQLAACRKGLRQVVQGLESLAEWEDRDQAAAAEEPRPQPNDGLVAELNRLLAELGGEASAAGLPVAKGGNRPEGSEELAREVRALLKEMRAGLSQSLLELAEANRGVRDQLVHMIEEAEVRQQKMLAELGLAADRQGDGTPVPGRSVSAKR